MAEKLIAIAERLDATAGQLGVRPLEFRRDDVFSAATNVEYLTVRMRATSTDLKEIAEDMRPKKSYARP